MAVQTITYGDKQYLNQNADIPATNKVQDTDMNEIKSVVNNNANELTNIGNYSTAEVNTGKTWIDGKSIYRKVLNCGALPNNSDKSVDINVEDIEQLVNLYGIGISTTGTCFPLPYVYNNLNSQIELIYLGGTKQIRITTGQDRTRVTGYVTIEYTKTN
jgi:hypothetical protein